MDRELADWVDEKLPPTFNDVVRSVMLEVWPDAGAKPAYEQSRMYGDIKDIWLGLPTPTRSAKERATVLALKPIPMHAVDVDTKGRV